MSRRLSSHRQEHATKRLMYMGVGFLVLVIFMLVFGLNFLISIGIWIGNTVSGNKETTENQQEFFGTIFMDDLPPATNSAEIFVSGTASDFEKIAFYVNSKRATDMEVMNEDTFSKKVSGLKEGKNTIYVVATNTKEKQRKQTEPVTVVYKKSKPKLEVSEPANDATVKSKEVTIKGSTDPGNTVEIDGAPVTVGASGAFQSTTSLKEGDNTVVITARDIATNEEKIELKLKYQKED